MCVPKYLDLSLRTTVPTRPCCCPTKMCNVSLDFHVNRLPTFTPGGCRFSVGIFWRTSSGFKKSKLFFFKLLLKKSLESATEISFPFLYLVFFFFLFRLTWGTSGSENLDFPVSPRCLFFLHVVPVWISTLGKILLSPPSWLAQEGRNDIKREFKKEIWNLF